MPSTAPAPATIGRLLTLRDASAESGVPTSTLKAAYSRGDLWMTRNDNKQLCTTLEEVNRFKSEIHHPRPERQRPRSKPKMVTEPAPLAPTDIVEVPEATSAPSEPLRELPAPEAPYNPVRLLLLGMTTFLDLGAYTFPVDDLSFVDWHPPAILTREGRIGAILYAKQFPLGLYLTRQRAAQLHLILEKATPS